MSTPAEQSQSPTPLTLAEFLESSPPDNPREVSDLAEVESLFSALSRPKLQLYCNSELCNGIRIFELSSEQEIMSTSWKFAFVKYVCRNCRQTSKTYAIVFKQKERESTSGFAQKLGEIPPFGPPVPSRVISLIGPDRELFLSGRRAENIGLGIGSFAYYRRVVENQKGRIIREIGKVAEKVGAQPATLLRFEKAAKETQFSQAVNEVSGAIPEALLIEGQNPLKLLHAALSDGLHQRSDSECLEIATSIRVLLTELADRISQTLKDSAELKNAVKRLIQHRESAADPNQDCREG